MAMAPALLPLLVVAAVVPAYAEPNADANADGNISFRPSVAIIVAIFSVMFSLTFLLLMYVKFCHNGGLANQRTGTGDEQVPPDRRDSAFLPGGARSSSGIDKAVIESLPFFLFSSLRGHRAGLECAVCLSRFDDAELLRLLPKCRHAFHAGCVDRWLESHSTCPLCRCRIDPALFNSSTTSSRTFSFRDDSRDDSASASASILELFVEREPDKSKKEKEMEERLVDDHFFLHKHKHKIVLSGPGGLRSRWSDLNSSDLVSLDVNNMLSSSSSSSSSSSKRLYFAESGPVEGGGASIKEDQMGGKKRSMSEMTSVSRFRTSGGGGGEDEKVRRVWLPIAQRTVRWFAGRERRPEQSDNNTTKTELTIVSEVSN